MWYRGKMLHLFVEDGVYLATKDYPSTSYRIRVWTLVDADEGKSVPEALAVQHTKLMIIFASSPRKSRWQGLTKTTDSGITIMNPWTRREISEGLAHRLLPSMFELTVVLCSAAIHELSASNSDIDRMFTEIGPTPRICYDYIKSPIRLETHNNNLESALASLSTRSLQKMVNTTSKLSLGDDDVSHTIVLLKRNGNDLSRDLRRVVPITPAIEMKLRDQLRLETRADRLALYRSLSNVAASRGLAGVVYESLVQETLQQLNTIELHLIPMTKTNPASRWRTNHVNGADTSTMLPLINISRMSNDAFSSTVGPIQEKVYYAPYNPNQAAVDSFIMDNNRLFIFQFTISDTHNVNEGILDLFSQESLPPRENWHYIFVVPSMLSELSCSRSKGHMKTFLEEIQLCSMVVDPQDGLEG